MAQIPQRYIDELRRAGLFAAVRYSSSHAFFPDGAFVGKPKNVRGNAVTGIRHFTIEGEQEIEFDSPSIVLVNLGDQWMVWNGFYGDVGDFTNYWKTGDEAIADIKDFYFGSFSRMQELEQYQQMLTGKVDAGNNSRRLPEECLQFLRDNGILISEPFPPTHKSFPDGVIVGKPASAGGNSIGHGFVGHYWDEPSDAPKLFLFSAGDVWRVQCEPGFGEFDNSWPTAKEAVEDVLDYYFGSGDRMQEAQEIWKIQNR